MEQRPWSGAADWTATHKLLILLSYTTQNHTPRSGPAHSDWAHQLQSSVKKISLGACPQVSLVGAFP